MLIPSVHQCYETTTAVKSIQSSPIILSTPKATLSLAAASEGESFRWCNAGHVAVVITEDFGETARARRRRDRLDCRRLTDYPYIHGRAVVHHTVLSRGLTRSTGFPWRFLRPMLTDSVLVLPSALVRCDAAQYVMAMSPHILGSGYAEGFERTDLPRFEN